MTKKKNVYLEPKAATNFWNPIWGVLSTHNTDVRWLQSVNKTITGH